jgi:four helix bundle protein
MEKPHKRLDVWQKAMELVRDVYQITQHFPADERYGLISQMRRASVSIASNLAEGAARGGPKELRQFAIIARASLSELDTQADIALMLGFVTEEVRIQLDKLMVRIDKMLYRLIEKC